jgi:drug/metabolite transporter (DMT)-like permease
MSPLLFALCANASFATASILFTEYSKRTSSTWMNFYKASVAAISFILTCWFLNLFRIIPGESFALLVVSGLSGLMIGDIFLLKAFVLLGSGRTLMVFGFQPIFLGIASKYLFGQTFEPLRLLAVIFLILCLFSFSFESFKAKGHWEVKGILFALIGVALDGAGVLMTRAAFEMVPELSPFYANCIRAVAAAGAFVLMSFIPKVGLNLTEPFKTLLPLQRLWITVASFFGTFMSLSFYLIAVQNGHLASISAVAGTTPLFATLIETVLGKRKFSIYLAAGLLFFILGFAILTLVSF